MIVVGYLFAALFFLTAFFFIVWFWSKGARWRSFGTPLLLVGTFGIMVIMVSKCAREAELEWNPSIKSDMEIYGTWDSQMETVVFKTDHTFDYRANSQTATGNWTRDDWNLVLHTGRDTLTMRLVEFRGHLRLMTHPPDDFDAWDGDVGLAQIAR